MSLPYDAHYFPPAPTLSVRLAYPGEAFQIGPLLALVDTGSDVSLVPLAHLELLDVPVSYPARVRLLFGPSRPMNVYRIDVGLGEYRLPSVEVVGDPKGTEIILGRNILNGLMLLLDGPGLSTDILSRCPKEKSL